ncbi:YbaK/EbsC family protein [Haloferax larsenii]|uniref:Cys-tRNA(Pro) deacylase, prolyl-tRNA editing enzyme YbaK/EbsC n=1 Tax=Haloferax larsenii TaxID=302484 RepID=A0A1H7PYK5_HALLR|nr:YbaK/EbsC family protein [Haloferax larsenii]SEL40832.1 Cys-tRNA(Pro) deacylase, prolyl-tRNA editing enzyme YbaK/EbsC [Haloferax larsenii]
MHPTAKRFADEVRAEHGIEIDVREFPEGTKTAADAADAIDCDVSQIVKSIVMRVGDETVVVLTSGANRVDEAALASEFDVDPAEVRSANAAEVKEATGWSIGGVPPTCHATGCPIRADPVFDEFDEIWAAAGTPEAVFRLTPSQLRELSNPRFVDVFE